MNPSLTEQFPDKDTVYVAGNSYAVLRQDHKYLKQLFATGISPNSTVLGVLSRATATNVAGILIMEAPIGAFNDKKLVEEARASFEAFHTALVKESGHARFYECVLYGPHVYPDAFDKSTKPPEYASALLYQTISRRIQSTPQFYPPRLGDTDAPPYELLINAQKATFLDGPVTESAVADFGFRMIGSVGMGDPRYTGLGVHIK